MKTTVPLLTLAICFFLSACLVTPVNAQDAGSGMSATKVSQLSDQQIMQLWQQAQRGGISESDAMKMLVKKGLDPSEVNGFKRRLVQMQGTNKSRFSTQSIIKDTADFMRDSSWVFEVPQLKKRSPYYGFDFFSNPDVSFEPNMNMPTPANYILGPKDELILTITGLNEASTNLEITRDGSVELPYSGFVVLSGLTIEQAKERIKTRLTRAYPGLATGRTQLNLSLANARSIRVSIIGEAERPGGYTVSGFTNFFNVLYLSGGPSQNGSLRNIELIRNNTVVERIDFYTFLQKGMLSKNLRLEDQDVIRFPVYQKRVSLNGEVKRPAIYELLEKETLAELIAYGGGLGDTAYRAAAKVFQIGNNERKIRDVVENDFSYFIPRNADSVHFEKVSPRFTNRIVISGAVKRPGNYELTEGLTLSQLIKRADGLRDDAFANRGYIKRVQPNADRDLVSFNVKNVLENTQSDLFLVREDSVLILAKDSLQDIAMITVAGNVREPGTFWYRKGMSLEDAVAMAGGFTIDAANHKVEISRLEMNRADTLANKLIDIITVDVDSSLQNSNSRTLLQPLDYVFVPRLLNYRTLGSVRVRGEVLYAGDYALEKRDETIIEVIRRAGGLSPYASISDVQVYRNNLRVGTDLYDGNKPADRFLLLPGDSIFIPRNEPFVEVKGAVFNPQILRYESSSFKSYISDAGGVTDKGNMRRAYIQYSNGISKQINHFLFFRNYPKVTPGSKIIIPEKTDTQRRGLSIVEISALTGSFTALISLISILRN